MDNQIGKKEKNKKTEELRELERKRDISGHASPHVLEKVYIHANEKVVEKLKETYGQDVKNSSPRTLED